MKLVLLIENYLTKKSRSGCYKRFVFSNRKVKIPLSKCGDAKYTYCIAGRPWFRPLEAEGGRYLTFYLPLSCHLDRVQQMITSSIRNHAEM